MLLRKSLLSLIASAAMLAGCATGAPKPANLALPEASRDKIASTEIVMPIPQKEIFFYEPAVAGGGATYVPIYTPVNTGMSSGAAATAGVIGLLVVAGIAAAQAADEAADLKPLRTAMAEFNFDEVLRTEVKTAMTQAAWLNAGEPRVLKQPKQEEIESAVAASTASGVLLVNTSYSINNNADEITVAITPRFYPSSPELKAMLTEKTTPRMAKTDPAFSLYHNTFTFRAQVPNAVTGPREVNIAAWCADNGAAMRAAMTMASAKLAQMLVDDMQTPSPPVDPKTTTLRPINAEWVSGHVLRNDADGQVVLLPSGGEVYLANSTLEPLQKAAGPDPTKKMSARERAKLQKEQEKARRKAKTS